ncbi:MAG: outer membrane lipoprotein-sorting protein [Bermanella sp.]
MNKLMAFTLANVLVSLSAISLGQSVQERGLEIAKMADARNQGWRPSSSLMQNHQTGKKTLLTWQNYKFKNNFKEKDFSKNSLKRNR